MLSQIFYALLTSAAVYAAPAHLHHKHEKREAAATVVVTVTAGAHTTSTVAAAASSAAASPAAASSVAASSVAASSAAASSAAASSADSSDASSTGSASDASSTYAAGSVQAAAGKGKGITYSPYSDSGSCKDSDTIKADVAKLADFEVIRVYAPDCSCVSAIMGSMGSSQKVFAGVYNYDSISADIDTLASQVEASSQGWDGIYAVSIGNEWVNSGSYSASQVASAVSNGRSLLSAKGWTGSVVTVDTVPAYEGNTALCDASDFIAVNSHAYWDGNVDPSDAGPWLEKQIDGVKSACGGSKDVLVCETGWPTQGSSFGSCVPSTENQLAAISSIADTCPDQVIFFTTYNDYWKDAGSNGVEQYWGIFQSS